MRENELFIPPEALEDPQAFELLRVWAASGEQHVTIRSNMNGGAHQFGYLLAQYHEHGARLYAQREAIDIDEARRLILSGFDDELRALSPTSACTADRAQARVL